MTRSAILAGMTENPYPTRTSRTAAFVDIENLAGPRPSVTGAEAVGVALQRTVRLSPEDLTVVASHPCNAQAAGAVSRRLHGQLLVRRGESGADKALIGSLQELPPGAIRSLVAPIRRVVIASGDGIFSHEVATQRMRYPEIIFIVVCWRGTLSRRLARVCHAAVYLDDISDAPSLALVA